MSSLFRGNLDFDDVTKRVNICIDAYTAAVVDLGTALGMQLVSYTREIKTSVDGLSERLELFMSTFETHSRAVETGLQNIPVPGPACQNSFIVPYERNPMFNGRDSLLERIRDELSKKEPKRYNHRLAIYGLGGMGKTQVALEYAYRYTANYEHVFWLRATDHMSIIADLANVALETKCVIDGGDNQETVARQVLKWLNSQGEWLVVLDNLDDVAVARDFLPTTECGGHVLATTRNANTKSIPMEGLEITEMQEAEAVELLMQLTEYPSDPQTIAEANQIVRELGRLPLAIDQAASFIRMSSFGTFLDVFKSNLSQFLKIRPEGPSLYPNSLFTTWTMSLTRLSADAIQLAELFAFLSPDEIFVEFLEAGQTGLNSVLRSLLENKFAFVKALSELVSLSLIKLRDHNSKISIHRLVQSVIRESLTDEDRLNRRKEALVISHTAFQYSIDDVDLESLSRCRKYLPQITGSFVYRNPETSELANDSVFTTIAAFLFDEGQFADCISLNQRIVAAHTETFGSEDPRTLRAKRGLAAAYHRRSRTFDLGLKLFEEVMDAQVRVLGPLHPDTLWTKHGLAVAYADDERISEAVRLLESTYVARCKVLGEENLHTLRSQYFLGLFCVTEGRPAEAKRLLEKTVIDCLRVLGRIHTDTLRSIQNLASVYDTLGQADEAQILYREALAIQIEMFGENHKRTKQLRKIIKQLENRNMTLKPQ